MAGWLANLFGREKESEAVAWVSDPSNPNDAAIEVAIREDAGKPTGELTKADLEELECLDLEGNQLTDVKGLEKLTKLENLDLENNPDLTKAQIEGLKKALPKCKIQHNAKK